MPGRFLDGALAVQLDERQVVLEAEQDCALVVLLEIAVGEEFYLTGNLVLPLDADLDRLVAAHQDVVVLPLEVEGQDRIGGAIGVARRLQSAIDAPGDLLVRCIRRALSRYSFHAPSNISHRNFVNWSRLSPASVGTL